MDEVSETGTNDPLDQLGSTDLYIDGEWIPAQDGSTFETVNPATGQPITHVAEASEADVNTAVEAASEAFVNWRGMDPDERGRIFTRTAQLIREHSDELAALETLDQGKPIQQAESDIEGAARYFEYYAGTADKLEGSSIPVGMEQVDYTVREPYGVSAQIIPWNFPANLFARGVAPALVAGNTTVVKPAEQTPLSALRLAELCTEAGVPDGTINVVPGFGDPTGRYLTKHENVAQITFTGSVPTGQAVMRAAADTVTPVTLELGGKNPALVFPDADLDAAAESIATGIFTNAGQVCSAADRAVVHESVADELIGRLIDIADNYDSGPGQERYDMGPVVSREHLDKISGYIDIGQDEGATIEIGGNPLDRSGYFIEPTVFTDVEHDMRIAQEEIFGPVLVVLTFNDTEEALRIANGTDYGLVAGVFTQDISRAHQLTQRIEAGNVYVNTWFGDTNQTPFGGYKDSGVGREKGMAALDSYLRTKNVAIDLGNDGNLPGA